MALKPDEKKGVIGSVLDSEPELIIRYYEDTDTLVLTTGLPGAYGETVAKGLVARSNEERDITSIVLEHAAELLRPYLFSEAKQEK